jgi:5-methylcytosine-specific restriction endonuclease McrA
VCSQACSKLLYSHGGTRPDLIACRICAAPVDLHEVGKGGRRRMSSTKLCRDCKTVHVKYGMTVEELAERDGTDCSICGEPVDMTLRRKDSVFCPSVDHRVPRAHGGTDDPDNLALAHYWCNAVKSDREDFTI